MSRLTRQILTHRCFRKSVFQPLWERLHNWTLVWMNYGGGGDFNTSGERWVIANLLRSRVRDCDAPIVFDVGANVGEYSVFCKQQIPNAAVYSFEPVGTSFRELKRRLAAFDGVHVFDVALSDRVGTADIYSYTYDGQPAGALASLGQKPATPHLRIEVDGTEQTDLTTVDAFCNQHGVDEIELLKIDVEGHELSVLNGAIGKIRHRKIRMIQFEFGASNLYSHASFLDFWSLLTPQYKIFRLVSDGIREMTYYEESKEIYVVTNYLAVLKD